MHEKISPSKGDTANVDVGTYSNTVVRHFMA